MTDTAESELRLSASKDAAIEAIRAALPQDAIVRNEDDGIGRFAGERTLVVVGSEQGRLQMFQGSWGALKGRLDVPQLEVVLEPDSEGVVARLKRAVPRPPTVMSRVWDLVSQVVTVAAVVVAYHLVRSIPVDTQRTAIIAAAGGLAWSAITHFLPKREDTTLDDLVRKALTPLATGDDQAADEPAQT